MAAKQDPTAIHSQNKNTRSPRPSRTRTTLVTISAVIEKNIRGRDYQPWKRLSVKNSDTYDTPENPARLSVVTWAAGCGCGRVGTATQGRDLLPGRAAKFTKQARLGTIREKTRRPILPPAHVF